jgi:hypothetical protein
MARLEVIFILLVPLAVWIFSSIFKRDDDRQGNRANAGTRPNPQRRPVTDLERFLEEARRRRETGEQRQPGSEAQPRPAPPRETRPTPVADRRPPRPPAPPRRQVSGPTPMATPRANRGPVLLQPVPDTPDRVFPPARVEPPRVEVARVEAPLPVPVVLTAMPVSITPMPPMQVVGGRTTPPPALAHLAALLRTSRAAGTAIVLREIFDEPLCRRRRS